jgi:hypothetical protein
MNIRPYAVVVVGMGSRGFMLALSSLVSNSHLSGKTGWRGDSPVRRDLRLANEARDEHPPLRRCGRRDRFEGFF